MAARTKRISHDAETRLKIKTSQLINRLQDFSLGKPGVIMTGDQVRAATTLLRKAVPDLQSVDLQGQVDSTITVNLLRFAGTPDSRSSRIVDAIVQSPKEPSQE